MESPHIMAEATPQVLPAVNNTGRLKYADPRSLPSYPSTGLRPDGAAAGAAATLGWNNQKPVELWKPDKISSASAAAVLAKDYKMAPQWEPSHTSDGHKAALLAVGSASAALKTQPDAPKPKKQHEGWGNSAATQAFNANRPAPAGKLDISHQVGSAATQAFNANRSQSTRTVNQAPPAQTDRSLLAAKGAMSLNLKRAHSTATASRQYEARKSSNAAANALNGATKAHRASMVAKTQSHDAGAVPVTTMTRNMFTSHPMVKPEVDERDNNERLHLSAVEMAKKMYSQQQKMLDNAKKHSESEGGGEESAKPQQPVYLNLQDAAYKQAQERLAKLHDEHLQSRDIQEYYGNTQAQKPRRRLTVTNKLRRKNSDDDFDDHAESQKIRQQMSMFSNKLSQVDQSKRQHDRDALMAAAQRNVKARLQGMDEKIYQDTGKINPSLLNEWEVKAQQAAQIRSETRGEHKGKVDLGGGMFMDPQDVDAIASKRMQPILDDINSKAEAERERLVALKLAEEARKEEAEKQKARDREMKEISKKMRDEEKQDLKAKRQQEKDEEKAKKKAENEKRKSKHDSGASGVGGGDSLGEHPAPADDDGSRSEVNYAQDLTVVDPVPVVETTISTGPSADQVRAPSDKDSPTSPQSKMRGWIRNRFSRSKSVSEPEPTADKEKKRRSIFRSSTTKKEQQTGTISTLEPRMSSMRDVAMAGRNDDDETQEHGVTGANRSMDSRGVSPVSSFESARSDQEFDYEDSSVQPPRLNVDNAPRSSISPNRGTRFKEEIGS